MGKQILLDYFSYIGKVIWLLGAKGALQASSSPKGDYIGRCAVVTPWRTLEEIQICLWLYKAAK